MAEMFGGGEYGEVMAEMLHRIEFDLPLDGLVFPESSKNPASDDIQSPIKPNPTESNPIRPNPTKFSNGQPPSTSQSDAQV